MRTFFKRPHFQNTIGTYGAGVLAALIVVSGGVAVWDWYESEYAFDPSVNPDTIQDADEYLEYYENLEEAYKEDTYGGETPEETLELFISALEDGDIELASKYFVLQKQEEKRDDLTTAQENDVLSLIVGDLKKAKRNPFQLSDIKYRFRTFNENNVAEFSFDLVLNQQTGVWKMYEL